MISTKGLGAEGNAS
ncbi:hypothetical protein DSL72_007822 [Monilinia vaccinii-corymbosi]|uniref:Uncharacterized protein n=1 Tax=Monilinia vaccinii-corymbosi TaxID=61207 RepID=A0A8A3PIQ1_9HELO|nr:hypothetical protein DSL72_007822 [Monilinia vaccinii-corymbosi]